MAVEVAWSPEAIEHIESIAAYIERDSSFYAKAVTQKILDLGRSLAAFPEAGRTVPELSDPAIRD